MACECRSIFCGIKARIIIAAIGLFVNLLAGVWFAGEFRAFNSSGFAFVAAVYSLLTLIIHIKYKKCTLHHWTPYLRWFMLFGCIGQLAGICAFITYIVLAIVLHQGLSDIHGENYWISLVWGWMTWKWAFATFWYSRMYRREYEQAHLLNKDAPSGVKPVPADGRTVVVSVDGEVAE